MKHFWKFLKWFGKRIPCLALLSIFLALPLCAQTPAPPADLYNNIFAAGPNWGQYASPQFTGSILEARLVSSGTNPIYSFTLIDLAPIKTKDSAGKTIFSFQTAVTTGVAPFSRQLGPGKLWIVGTIGGAAAATKAGLAWSTGGAYSFRIKGNWLGMLNLRVLKSTVSSDYQGVIGMMIGYGNK
jgi:hypothetical protein